jgi:hypothetical protein
VSSAVTPDGQQGLRGATKVRGTHPGYHRCPLDVTPQTERPDAEMRIARRETVRPLIYGPRPISMKVVRPHDASGIATC